MTRAYSRIDEGADAVKQSFSLLQQSLRWVLSILCITFLLASLKIYQDLGNLNPTQINVYNAISGALQILLSLSFFVSLIQSLSSQLP